jgi:hypothetical protein
MTDPDTANDGNDEPIACTLDGDEAVDRQAFVAETFAPHVERIEMREDGWRIQVEHAEPAVDGITTFARREHECCSFAHYEVHLTPGDGPNALSIYGPEETADLFRAGLVEPLVSEFDAELVDAS